MKRVITPFGEFVTGGQIADAVSRYGLALARAYDSDLVEIPHRRGDHIDERVELRIGWLVDFGVASDTGQGNELLDPETVARLDELARSVAIRGFGCGRSPRTWTYWEYEL